MKTIREFAELCGTTEKTLRYYDRIGILRPDYTDPENGYRYYTEQQKTVFRMIRWYKSMGFTMNEIRQIYSRTGTDVREMVRRKRESLMASVEACDRWTEAMDAADEHLEKVSPVNIETVEEGRRLILTQDDRVCSIAAGPEILEKCRRVWEVLFRFDPPPLEEILPEGDLTVFFTWSMKGTVKEFLAADLSEIREMTAGRTKIFLCTMKVGRCVEESEANAVRERLLEAVFGDAYGRNLWVQNYDFEMENPWILEAEIMCMECAEM